MCIQISKESLHLLPQFDPMDIKTFSERAHLEVESDLIASNSP